MGRKIPGKKHRGVKDPEKQQLVRFKRIENKINTAPSNPDEQDVPKSLQQFIKLKESAKKKPASVKKTQKNPKSELITIDPGLRKENKMYSSKNSAPAFNQRENESTYEFMVRVKQTVNEVIREQKFEDKFKVKVERNLKTGEVENVSKQSQDPLVSYMKEIKERKKQMDGKNKKNKKAVVTKSQKKKLKLEEKKARRNEEVMLDFNVHTDKVEFGEVVHAPPTLVTPKKVTKMNCAPRPGTKDLLLKSVLKQNLNNTNNKSMNTSKKSVFQKIQGTGKIDKKGKRKDLPHAVRRQLENQRNEIVTAYRSLKLKKKS